MEVISNETFTKELDASLKRQKINIKERKSIIADYFLYDEYLRDGILDKHDLLARKFEAEQKELKHIPSEFKEQCDFVEWFKKEYKGAVIMSIRNGGSRTPRERVDQIAEGLHPGAADLFIPEWFLWIEFKKKKGGIQSDKQKDFEKHITNVGYTYFLALGCEDGKNKLLEFLENKK